MKKETNILITSFYDTRDKKERKRIVEKLNILNEGMYSTGPDYKGNMSLFKIVGSIKMNEELYTI